MNSEVIRIQVQLKYLKFLLIVCCLDESRQHEIEDSIVGGLMLIKAYMRKNESFNPTASLMANVGHPNVDRNRWSQMAQVRSNREIFKLLIIARWQNMRLFGHPLSSSFSGPAFVVDMKFEI